MRLNGKVNLWKNLFWGSVATILLCGLAILVAPARAGVSPSSVVLLSIRHPWIFFVPILTAVHLFWSDAQEDVRPMWCSLIRSTAVAAAIYVLEVVAMFAWVL